MKNENQSGWAAEEFAEVDLGDKRLNQRLIHLCGRLSEAPESPINQACEDSAEAKAAYRFFQNEGVDSADIMAAHSSKTVGRAQTRGTILAIQDSSYFIYTGHPKTQGLGDISMKKGRNVKEIYSRGLTMHTCLAVTTEGLPLGLLSNKITARESSSRQEKAGTRDRLPIEEKESYRWLEALQDTTEAMGNNRVVTVCDRESDIYDFFKLSDELNSPVLVRASSDRAINKKSRYAEKDVVKLWAYMGTLSEAGSYKIDIQRKSKSKHCSLRQARTATVSVRFGSFRLNPPRNHPKQKSETLPDLQMYAIHVLEENPPKGEEGIEWMLLTNLEVTSYEKAYEKIRWYGLRWRVEMFFKVIKSGFRVEDCRLAHGERLARYLTIMSIVAWRLFMITIIARTDQSQCCSSWLTTNEWRVLIHKTMKSGTFPDKPPTIKEAVDCIAKLGGHLGRKCDAQPGTLTLWRGWKRLRDLVEGAELANTISRTCG